MFIDHSVGLAKVAYKANAGPSNQCLSWQSDPNTVFVWYKVRRTTSELYKLPGSITWVHATTVTGLPIGEHGAVINYFNLYVRLIGTGGSITFNEVKIDQWPSLFVVRVLSDATLPATYRRFSLVACKTGRSKLEFKPSVPRSFYHTVGKFTRLSQVVTLRNSRE